MTINLHQLTQFWQTSAPFVDSIQRGVEDADEAARLLLPLGLSDEARQFYIELEIMDGVGQGPLPRGWVRFGGRIFRFYDGEGFFFS